MSRLYHMQVVVENYRTDRRRAIVSAAEAVWPFEAWDEDAGHLITDGDGALAGGEDEEAFAQRLARAVWRANERYCEVSVDATYLDDFSCNSYGFSEREYTNMMTAVGGGRPEHVEKDPPAVKGSAVKPQGLRFDPLHCPQCGGLPVGTLEQVTGMARLHFAEDGAAEYDGWTEIFWDGQMTVRDGEGRVTLFCAESHSWQAMMSE